MSLAKPESGTTLSTLCCPIWSHWCFMREYIAGISGFIERCLGDFHLESITTSLVIRPAFTPSLTCDVTRCGFEPSWAGERSEPGCRSERADCTPISCRIPELTSKSTIIICVSFKSFRRRNSHSFRRARLREGRQSGKLRQPGCCNSGRASPSGRGMRQKLDAFSM